MIGNLLRWVRLRPTANAVDAALSTIQEQVTVDPTYAGQSIRGWRDEVPSPDDYVWKVGRTTGVTSGLVRAVEVDGINVDYSEAGNGSTRSTDRSKSWETRTTPSSVGPGTQER